MKLVAEQLRTCWVVRPEGKVGMMGWTPEPWTIQFFKTYQQAQAYIRRMS